MIIGKQPQEIQMQSVASQEPVNNSNDILSPNDT